jgi:hypothetical protein
VKGVVLRGRLFSIHLRTLPRGLRVQVSAAGRVVTGRPPLVRISLPHRARVVTLRTFDPASRQLSRAYRLPLVLFGFRG